MVNYSIRTKIAQNVPLTQKDDEEDWTPTDEEEWEDIEEDIAEEEEW